MSPFYAIMESPHRWLILAGISFVAACLGAMMMLAWAWPHPLALVWFYAGAIITAFFLWRTFAQWAGELQGDAERLGPGHDRGTSVSRRPGGAESRR